MQHWNTKWFYAAIICGVIAIGADFAAKSFAGQIAAAGAREASLVNKGAATPTAELQRQKETLAGRLKLAGIAEILFVVLFVAFWLTSRETHERAPRIVLLILLIVLVCLSLTVV